MLCMVKKNGQNQHIKSRNQDQTKGGESGEEKDRFRKGGTEGHTAWTTSPPASSSHHPHLTPTRGERTFKARGPLDS